MTMVINISKLKMILYLDAILEEAYIRLQLRAA